MKLRDYQSAALDKARARYAAGKRAVLLVAPTGAGKTVMLSAAALGHHERKGQVVILVHRTELIKQTLDKLWKTGLRDIGAIAAQGGFNFTAPVVVCSVQTLLAREHQRPKASLLIADEAHHYLSAEWNKVAGSYSGVPVLGFTATPCRADGTALGGMFDCLEVVATNRELVDAGHLVPVDVVGPAKRLEHSDIIDPVSAYEKHAPGRRAVFFAGTKQHGRDLLARLGERAGYVDGETPADERARLLAQFEAGEIIKLVNVFVLTEGWDCPPAEVCVLARGLSSAGAFIQTTGRVRRPFPGKARALLIDCKGAVYEHGLPDDERVFSLEGLPIRLKGGPGLRQCPQCGAVFELAPVCERCAYSFPVEQKTVREKQGELRTVDNVTPENSKRAFLREQLSKAKRDGKKPGWAAYRFKWRFGFWPNPAWMKEERTDATG
jgi:DNA repair protein RadD